MSKNPWFKFYPTDWKADNQLKLCSAAARGLWIEMLCICHQATPYGHFLIDGSAPTETELSVLTGIPTEQITTLIGELSSRSIFSRTSKGVFYSRKMVNDEKKSREGKKHVKKRWDEPPDNKEENPLPNRSPSSPPKTHIPEARYKKERKKKEPPPDGSVLPLKFEGNVVRLTERDWGTWLVEFSLTDEQLGRLICERDDFLKKLEPSDARRERWWVPTRKWLSNETENLRKSTR